MLPLPLQFLIAMVAHAINERMARDAGRVSADCSTATAARLHEARQRVFGHCGIGCDDVPGMDRQRARLKEARAIVDEL
jgi:hypothetical protein